MEPPTDTGSFMKGFIFLLGFTSLMAFFVYLFFKLTAVKNTNTNGESKGQNAAEKERGVPVKTVKKGKKDKPLRERTLSKGDDHLFEHKWLQTSLKGHSEEVKSMAFSPNFKYLASIGNDRVVFLWLTKYFASADHKQIRVNLGFEPANKVCFSPDSKAFLVSKNSDMSVEVYKIVKKTDSAGGGSHVQSAIKVKTDHTSDIIGLGIHPKFMMTCEKQGRLNCWNFKGSLIDKVVMEEGVTYSAKISLCGRYIGICGKYRDNNNVSIYNLASTQEIDLSGKILKDKKPIWTHNKEAVFSFDWSTDSSKLVALGNQDGQGRELIFKLFDITGLRAGVVFQGSLPVNPLGDTETLPVIRLSSNGFLLLVGAYRELFIYSTLMGGLLLNKVSEIHGSSPLLDIVFSEGDKQFITCGDKAIRIFNNVPGKQESLRHMEKQIGEKSTGQALKTRLKIEVTALNEEIRPFL